MHCRMLLIILETWFLGHLKIMKKLYQKKLKPGHVERSKIRMDY